MVLEGVRCLKEESFTWALKVKVELEFGKSGILQLTSNSSVLMHYSRDPNMKTGPLYKRTNLWAQPS